MVWLHPAAWLGAIAIAAPVLIHLLVHRRAETLLFPTLRFLEPTRLASIRRHRLDDRRLLLARVAILVAAAGAFAGPVAVTAARRAEWNARTVRAIVTDLGPSPAARRATGSAFLATLIDAPDLKAGIRQGAEWLEEAPPAQRELVVVSAFPQGAISSDDIAAVPQNVGIRFLRAGALLPRRNIDAGNRLGVAADARDRSTLPLMASRRNLSVLLDGAWTRVTIDADDIVPLPIELNVPAGDRTDLAAALSAVLSQGVFAPAPGRAARVAVGAATASKLNPGPVSEPWMGDAIAAIARDMELQRAAGALASGLDDRPFAQAPWTVLAAANDGKPAAVASADGGRLLVASVAPASHIATPLLLRALFNALAPAGPVYQEVLSIREEQLRAWQRAPASVSRPATQTIDRDDRRWVWAAVLALLALEAWARRSRTGQDGDAGERDVEAVRVA